MAEQKTHVYESATLGVPPLKMILVHARNEAQNASELASATPAQAAEKEPTPLAKEQVVRKLIRHLESPDS
jgi:hypothetical protein